MRFLRNKLTVKEAKREMKLIQFVRNQSAVFFLAALAASVVVYLGWAIGANVNCLDPDGTGATPYTCYSTNGTSNSTTFTSATVFTGENDTASIECPTTAATFSSGGGNDVIYLRDPVTGTPANNTIVNGEDGDDIIVDGCSSDNDLRGGNGNDIIIEDAAGTLTGGDGNDLLAGGQDNDFLDGGNGNDVIIGGPGLDKRNSTNDLGDGDANDDIFVIHKGDVPATQTEAYVCTGSDTILVFGFDRDGVVEVPPTTSPYTLTDPVTGGTYSFSATSPDKCTIIFVD